MSCHFTSSVCKGRGNLTPGPRQKQPRTSLFPSPLQAWVPSCQLGTGQLVVPGQHLKESMQCPSCFNHHFQSSSHLLSLEDLLPTLGMGHVTLPPHPGLTPPVSQRTELLGYTAGRISWSPCNAGNVASAAELEKFMQLRFPRRVLWDANEEQCPRPVRTCWTFLWCCQRAL